MYMYTVCNSYVQYVQTCGQKCVNLIIVHAQQVAYALSIGFLLPFLACT